MEGIRLQELVSKWAARRGRSRDSVRLKPGASPTSLVAKPFADGPTRPTRLARRTSGLACAWRSFFAVPVQPAALELLAALPPVIPLIIAKVLAGRSEDMDAAAALAG
jgi:hypothetical protein